MKKHNHHNPPYQSKRAGKVKKAYSPKVCKVRDRRREKAEYEAAQERVKRKKEEGKLHKQAPKEKPQFDALTQAVVMPDLLCQNLQDDGINLEPYFEPEEEGIWANFSELWLPAVLAVNNFGDKHLKDKMREEMHKTLLSQSTKTPTIEGMKYQLFGDDLKDLLSGYDNYLQAIAPK